MRKFYIRNKKFLVTLSIFVFFILFSYKYPEKKIETIVIVNPYSNGIKENIENYSKQGYEIKFLVCQNVTSPNATMKGDFILVMEKNK